MTDTRPRKSASRLDAYNRCQAYYGYKYISKIPQPTSKAAEHGSKIHDELERYYKAGVLPLDPAALALLRILPEPQDGLAAEGSIECEWEGHRWIAIMDLRKVVGTEAYVGDHKTTSDLKWAKTPEILLTDTQAVLYALLTFDEFPNVTDIKLNWNYVTRGKRNRTLPVVLDVKKSDLNPLPLLTTATEIDRVHATCTDVETLEKDTQSCGMFGGCPYAGTVCHIKPSKAIGSRLMGLSLKDKLKNAKNKPAQAVNPPTQAAQAGQGQPVESTVAGVLPPAKKTAAAPIIDRDTNRMVPMPDTSMRYGLHMVVDALCDKFKL